MSWLGIVPLFPDCLHILIYFNTTLFHFFADCCCLEAFDEEAWTLEIHPFHCPTLWCGDGDDYFHPCCILLVVPICINIPNSTHVQPSFQPRSRNLPHPCPQHRDMISIRQLGLYCKPELLHVWLICWRGSISVNQLRIHFLPGFIISWAVFLNIYCSIDCIIT